MSNKLYVGNLPFSLTEDALEQLFASIGSVQNVKIPTDRDTGRPRGFAFVEMGSDEDASSAVDNLNGQEVGGRRISVAIATERPNSGGPSHRPNVPRGPRADSLGTDTCILCQTGGREVFGFDESVGGICQECISALSRASRPPMSGGRPQNKRY